MKSRKPRLAKAGTSKRKVSSDISPSTSLPPLVEGQLRCFLRVTVSRVLWTVHKPPSNTFIRLRWWGETSNGTHFFPRDGSQASQKSVKTTTRFPIRCGPKQFTSYLTDMGYIVLEALTKPDHLPIARAQVAGIPRLSLSHSLSGFYTLVSPTSEKMGELQVSLCLEPLTEAYDSSSSCPPTDISIDKAPQEIMSSEPKVSAGNEIELSESTRANTPRGKDHLYFQRIERNKALPGNQTLDNCLANPAGSGTDPTSDLLSVILERGNKLRNAMVVSAVDTDITSAPTVMDPPFLLSRDNTHFHTKPPSSSPGTLLQNILLTNTNMEPSCGEMAVCDHGLDTSDIDHKAVDLLLGSSSPLPLWDDLSALSNPSSLGGDSELNDPQYDQSLLENVFYKSPAIDEQTVSTELGVQTQEQKHSTSGATEQPLTQSKTTNGVEDMVPHSLSADQFNTLSSIQLLRVCVDSLTVPSENPSTSSRNNSKGKPPRPLCTKKCTYFVEYVLPRVSAVYHKNAEEVTRAVSSKITGEVVRFSQRSLFPVHFSTAALKLWWETDLIFRIYLRRSDQKKPILIGRAVHPLRSLLLSKSLSQSLLLPASVEEESETKYIGPLKVTLELVTGKKDSQIPIKTLAQRDATPWDTTDTPVNASFGHKKDAEVPVMEVSMSSPRLTGEALCPHSFHTSPSQHRDPPTEESTNILLHALLMVPDARDFQSSPLQSLNLYLNCKLFWCDETVRSHVAWGQASPTFNFVQVTPVALTSKLLERMKNNVMVIEVWQKIGSPKQDHLLGLVKLPLHQFYMSFRDVKIAHLLLRAQYPVLGVDCYMPVIDGFSGNCKGNLRVILAMGRSEQISALQSARGEEYHAPAPVVRPVHLLDHQPHSKPHKLVTRAHNEIMKEHVFVVKVEKVVGLTPLQSTVWGEADCYIQYTFPCQEGDFTANIDLIESTINLKSFRTTTTLCVPDPLFGHTERHVLLAPEEVPIQKVLLSSLSCQGLSGGGGVQFEVWCRYYYPNVRDQLVAKGTLPLSKLCAMVTMQRLHNEAQMFSLPLSPWTDTDQQPQPTGLLDVCVEYKHRPVRPEGQMGRGAASRLVTLVIQIHRASGLKTAARVVAETNERFNYYTSVGVNSYITAQLSFLPERETRCTRTVARSFSPEFDHYMEMSCDLLLQRSTGESISLAEQLEQASAIFTLWNKESRKGAEASQPKDVQLGTVKVPLANLIYKRTGISGWFGVHALKRTSSEEQPILVGGVEISIRFAHHSDRERMLKAAQSLGWEMAHRVYLREEDEESWEEDLSKISLSFSVPRAWIPVHCLLLPGLREMQRSTYCYFRYKFYDQEPFCSHMKHPVVEEEKDTTVSFEGSATVELKRTQSLMWYLREEMLEIQIWVAFTKDKTQRPCDTDRLVGSAFLDLSALAKISEQKLTLSGVYPLFRRSAADLQGAALRVHITLALGSGPRMTAHTDTDEEDLLSDEVDDTELKTIERSQKTSTNTDITTVQHIEMDNNESFPMTVTVDKAMHLNLTGCPLTDSSEGIPCCCVSYVTADSSEPVSTAVISNNDNPVWDHQHECRLPKDLLVDSQQSLVFKVWHKGENERVIGFASVDLTPLLCGLPSVCGWYNITDFSGHCHGQLKVSITPLQRIHDLRLQRKTAGEEKPTNSSGLFQGHPITYHTTATYSSFPSHISRYPEQNISSPDHTEILFSERSSVSDRHFEHMDKVRLYHQSIHEQITAPSASGTGDLNPSSSILFSNLRKRLGELDNIQRYFSHKLSIPTFPMSDEDVIHKPEVQKTSKMDTPHLLLKSNMLIGQVNNIISGLQGQNLETIPSIPQSNLKSPVENPAPQATHGTPESSHNTPTTSQQPLLATEKTIHSSHKQDFQNDVNALSEEDERKETDDEEGAGCKIDQDAEYDDNEDYEETVVKPRHLNELTSLTDKTSPWTSILSDPDLVSLESVDTELSHGEKDEQLTTELPIKDSSGNTSSECEEDNKSDNISEKEESDTDEESPRTYESLHLKMEDKELEFNSESEDEPDGAFSTEIHNPISTEKINDPQPKPPVIPEVPNFFLSPHQMEASMKVIRLAPSFSQSPVDLGHNAVPARGPRLRPNMSPSSLRKETDRIARIFAAHFDEVQRN